MRSSYTLYSQPYIHPAVRDPERLTVAGMTFAYADVADYEVATVVERDWQGQLLCAGIYGLASALFLIGILLGMDWKFWIAVIFLGSISFMSVCDARGTRPVTTHVLDMTLWNGRAVRFVDADRHVVDTLVARIERDRAPRRTIQPR
jgi:hypothetical protein